MRTKIRYLTPFFAAAGACAAIAMAPVAAAAPDAPTPDRPPRSARPTAARRSSPRLREQRQLGLAVGRRLRHRLRRLGSVVTRRLALAGKVSANLTFLFALPDREWVSWYRTPRRGCGRAGFCSGRRSSPPSPTSTPATSPPTSARARSSASCWSGSSSWPTSMAGLVQYLSAKLGLVTGRSLPEAVGRPTAAPHPDRLLAAGRIGGHGNRSRRGGRRRHRPVPAVRPAAADRRRDHRRRVAAAARRPEPPRPAHVRDA